MESLLISIFFYLAAGWVVCLSELDRIIKCAKKGYQDAGADYNHSAFMASFILTAIISGTLLWPKLLVIKFKRHKKN